MGDIVDGSEREDHISQIKSENSKSEDVIEKGEEFKMEDSVEDDKNEYVQQTDDAEISVINDSKKLEVEKNDVIEKEDVAEISVIYDCLVPEVEKNDDMEII